MYTVNQMELVYYIANNLTSFVQSLYAEGTYSRSYRDLYRVHHLDLESMTEYFPFMENIDKGHKTLELLKHIILFHVDKGPKARVAVGELTNLRHPDYSEYLLPLIELGLIRLSVADAGDDPMDIYIQILDFDNFIQAYKTALVKYLLSFTDFNLCKPNVLHLVFRIVNDGIHKTYINKDVYKEHLDICIDRVATYWTSKSNKYLGTGNSAILFPFMTDAERRLLLLMQYNTKTTKKNKNIDFTFSLKELEPERDISTKYRSICSLLQMGFIDCAICSFSPCKWKFSLTMRFKVADIDTIVNEVYPIWMSRYLATNTRHIESISKI